MTFLRAQRRARARAPSVADAARAVDIVVAQYEAGTTDLTRVTLLQQNLVPLEDTLCSARRDRHRSDPGLSGFGRRLGDPPGGRPCGTGFAGGGRPASGPDESVTILTHGQPIGSGILAVSLRYSHNLNPRGTSHRSARQRGPAPERHHSGRHGPLQDEAQVGESHAGKDRLAIAAGPDERADGGGANIDHRRRLNARQDRARGHRQLHEPEPGQRRQTEGQGRLVHAVRNLAKSRGRVAHDGQQAVEKHGAIAGQAPRPKSGIMKTNSAIEGSV